MESDTLHRRTLPQQENDMEDKSEDCDSDTDSIMSSITESITNNIKQNIETISHIPEKIAHIPEKIAHMAWNIIPFESLPHWLKDNEFLTTDHRPPMYSFTGCFKSMFRLHTETWNIWTHLLGFVFFTMLTLGVYIFRDSITHFFEDNVVISDLPWDQQFMLSFFFIGAMVCLLFSATFHTLCNHSFSVYNVTCRMDYTGIAILITGSSIPAYYYAFYCITVSRYIHIGLIVALCAGCIYVSYGKKFCQPGYRRVRFALFVMFGLYGCVPTAHLWLIKGLEEPYGTYLRGLALMAVIYLTGAGLYVLRIPERFKPGAFNVWAHSHQLFHLCVIAAAIVHCDTLMFMVKYRLLAGTCADALRSSIPMIY